jgi:AcrR family transcriptional regulator
MSRTVPRRKSTHDPLAALAAFDRIPPRPPPELDRVLDATERCLARYGVRRTSMTDIAREMGVARTTLYRQVSSIEEAVALASSRQFFLFVDDLTALLGSRATPQAFIDAAVRTVTFARTSPLALRLLRNEPELIGGVIASGRLSSYVDQVVDLVAPVLEAAMSTGTIRDQDPRLLAGLIVRLIGVLIVAPADDDLEQLVQFTLEPLLLPERARRTSAAAR